MAVPKKKKEEIKEVEISSPTARANKMPYSDLFKIENDKLIAKQDIVIGGISYKEGENIEDTQWDKYNLKDNSLTPIVIRKKNGLEIIGLTES